MDVWIRDRRGGGTEVGRFFLSCNAKYTINYFTHLGKGGQKRYERFSSL